MHSNNISRLVTQVVEERYGYLLTIVLAITAALAWLNRFVVDDAFISFLYARNLVEGHGLVFNLGDRLEGYTNFLWTLLMALPHAIDIDPIQFCYMIGPALAVLTVYLTNRTVHLLTGSKTSALVAALLVGTHSTFSAWATGGLETQLLTSLFAGIFWLFLKGAPIGEIAHKHYLVLSLLSTAALMTRLDSAIVVGVAIAVTMLQVLRSNAEPKLKLMNLLELALPAIGLIGIWFGWKLYYYGELLPNTYYVKISGGSAWPSGLVYMWRFLNSYFWWPLLLVLVLGMRALIIRTPTRAVPLTIAVVGYIAYVVHVGGDFMEFRILVPIIPMLYILLIWSLHCIVANTVLRSCVVALAVAGSIHHAITFETVSGIESTNRLTRNLYDPASDWVGVGHALKRDLGPSTGVRIALTPVGAIPYFSRLDTLDMLGLVDRWVARNGLPIFLTPGHRRVAPFSYIASQNVNLVIVHPWLEPSSGKVRESYNVMDLWRMGHIADVTPIVFPANTRIVEVPLDSGNFLIALYITKHASIDALIASGRWRSVRLTNRN